MMKLVTSPPTIGAAMRLDRKSTRLNSSHTIISYAVFCLKKKKQIRLATKTQDKREESKNIIEAIQKRLESFSTASNIHFCFIFFFYGKQELTPPLLQQHGEKVI